MFQLTFLGTSAGLPTKYRNVTGLAVECVNNFLSGDKKKSKSQRPWILIDCGEGTQHQLLHTKLSLHRLEVICITHVHGDHCYGLAGLLASMAMAGRKSELTLIAPQAISKLLDTLSITTELYFPFPVRFIALETLIEQQNAQLTIAFSQHHQLTIDVIALSHRAPSHAFALTQNISTRKLDIEKLYQLGIEAGESWGKLQRGESIMGNDGQLIEADSVCQQQKHSTKIIVAGDNDTPELLSKACDSATLLVHEATYTQAVLERIQHKQQTGQMAIDPMHSSVQSVAQFAQSVELPNLILTHFSARYQPYEDIESDTANMAHIRAEATAYYHGNLWLAEDFATYSVDENGVKLISSPEAVTHKS
ncbi:ribonuclease Z [Psychrobacter sp. I-STPA6b]|uniref:ribonuclease Z n=1 Tax=Psychrobacter sp. I-STPA6b TaxID=2585718 RepID=UPI001D0C500C|nr:ribonuclease Z [Psychrobacter sp. I-STPA6b]